MVTSKWRIALDKFSKYVIGDDFCLYRYGQISANKRNLSIKKIKVQNKRYYWLRDDETGKIEKWSLAQLRPHIELLEEKDKVVLVKPNSPF